MRRSSPIALLALTLPLFGSVLATGCAETPTLFDENGVWLLTEAQITDTPFALPPSAAQGFLLAFSPGKDVVAAAACRDSTGSTSPAESLCHFDPNTTWDCKCFAYTFEESQMTWTEFAIGMPAPQPPASGDMAASVITVAESTTPSSYVFTPLPMGLFGAEAGSSFTFQRRSENLWTQPPPPPNTPQMAAGDACNACFPP